MKVYSLDKDGPFHEKIDNELKEAWEKTGAPLRNIFVGNLDFFGIGISEIRPVDYESVINGESDGSLMTQ